MQFYFFSSEKLVSCIYLSELENLHISQSEEAFLRCNKEGLVKGLWRNHSREPQVSFYAKCVLLSLVKSSFIFLMLKFMNLLIFF